MLTQGAIVPNQHLDHVGDGTVLAVGGRAQRLFTGLAQYERSVWWSWR